MFAPNRATFGRLGSRGTYSHGGAGATDALGGLGVPFSRSPTAADSSFVTTSVALPGSYKPNRLKVTVSTGSVQVQVQLDAIRVLAGIATVNAPLDLDISPLPKGSTVPVQTLAAQACTIQGVVTYDSA